LSHTGTLAELASFCQRYQPLLVVNVAVSLTGLSSVIVDSGSGAEMSLEHLLRAHHYRQVSFISWPDRPS
jgi:hypothetical protein